MMDSPHISQPVLGFFRTVVRGYFRRHFHAVRLSRSGQFPKLGPGPLILYANHSSWWDPMVSVLLAGKLMPERQHFAPMDANALRRYAILRQIGVFGVELNSPRGAVQFLRTGLALLERGAVLWVTPQGRFADARERPLVFKPGLAALAARVKGGCTVLPLAIEYAFWDERLPEVLLHFGQPVRVRGQSAAEIEPALEQSLEQAMDALRASAISRDAAGFEIVQEGRAGTGGFYERGQRAIARLTGRRFQAEHTAVAPHGGDARE